MWPVPWLVNKCAHQQDISVPGEPVVKNQPRHGVGRKCLKVPAEGPGEEHHFAQTTAPLLKHTQQFCSIALEVLTLSQWNHKPQQQMRMSLLAGCKTNTIATAVCFAGKAYSCRKVKVPWLLPCPSPLYSPREAVR
jgi:hypothetical protein